MPGYGASQPVEPLTFPAIAAAVVELLDMIGASRADLVGESFGGMQALHTAAEYPARVGRLVLAGTSGAFGLDGTDETRPVEIVGFEFGGPSQLWVTV